MGNKVSSQRRAVEKISNELIIGEMNVQGGAQWNSSQQQQNYQPSGQGQEFQHGAGHRIGPDGDLILYRYNKTRDLSRFILVDADQAVENASRHAGGAGGNELFGNAMSFLHNNSVRPLHPHAQVSLKLSDSKNTLNLLTKNTCSRRMSAYTTAVRDPEWTLPASVEPQPCRF